MSGLQSVLTRVRRDATGPDVAAALDAVVAAAQRAWPMVSLDASLFVAHLGDRLPPHVPVADALAALYGADLYLACACARGNTSAIATFDREYLARAGSGVARIDRSPDFVDEVRQRVRERLLVGTPPRIAEYNGSGPLAGWLRVVSMRVALNARRDANRVDRLRISSHQSRPDPELDVIRGQYRAEIEVALKTALGRLDDADREVIRLHYIDGWSFEQIGGHYDIDRSNASRRVARARRFLLAETRRELARLAPTITTASRDSLLVALRSRIQFNLESALNR